MNVLLLGSGGREHALAWKLAQSPLLGTLYAAPGNPGIAAHATIVALDAADHGSVCRFAHDHDITLVVVGPEAPLVDGLGNALRADGIAVFGPDRDAAQLEGSKGFTKDLCREADIPTAAYVRVNARAEAEATLASTFARPVVIKADGLAGGKGVTIAYGEVDIDAALDAIFADGPASAVIEEYLDGEEVSLFVLSDGKTLVPFGSAQDHKRVGDGDTGPNTGGMGAYSPAPVLTRTLERQAIERIITPTIDTLAERGTPFVGVLYAGLMLTSQGPKLIEYNVRFGDPEAQVLMMRLGEDLLPIMMATAKGRLSEITPPKFTDEPALGVVIAARGYPGITAQGGRISGIVDAEGRGAKVFQAGTREQAGDLIASGGRVLTVTAEGPTIVSAQRAAYDAAAMIEFTDGFYRQDIGWRAIAANG